MDITTYKAMKVHSPVMALSNIDMLALETFTYHLVC